MLFTTSYALLTHSAVLNDYNITVTPNDLTLDNLVSAVLDQLGA